MPCFASKYSDHAADDDSDISVPVALLCDDEEPGGAFGAAGGALAMMAGALAMGMAMGIGASA